MKSFILGGVLLFFASLAGDRGFAGGSRDAANTTPNLTLEKGILNLPLKGSRATAAYGIIRNSSKRTVLVEPISAEGFEAVEFHRSEAIDGVSRMVKMDRVEIAANSSWELRPGGDHIMLFDPNRRFSEGAHVKLRVRVLSATKPAGKISEQILKFTTVKQAGATDGHHHH